MTTPFFPSPPRRVVSLVPSITESLFDLGFGDSLVGATDYCVHPTGKVSALKKVGGTKNARVEEILALQPELVIASQEENTPAMVQALEAAGVPVWLTFPKTVDETLADLRHLADIFQGRYAYIAVDMLERGVEFARAIAADEARLRVFCPIWRGEQDGQIWYMTCNAETYTSDLLAIFGGENVFAARQRRYPLEADLKNEAGQAPEGRDTRYPHISLDEMRAARPELILLPSEPFAFDENHLAELKILLADTPAIQNGRIHLLDGSLITWPGTRLGKALEKLPEYFK
ncbi:MAG: ABC transporter substrate-binding protein [Chloroflexi bacterium HGW-Chloroflexi-6]|nr:MAG: ABC transporter substrate-binding protein [Chloroflexi bacterium HGW-Chloroflexi-6]